MNCYAFNEKKWSNLINLSSNTPFSPQRMVPSQGIYNVFHCLYIGNLATAMGRSAFVNEIIGCWFTTISVTMLLSVLVPVVLKTDNSYVYRNWPSHSAELDVCCHSLWMLPGDC